MQTFFNMLAIAVSVVYVLDFAGIVEKLKYKAYYLKYKDNVEYEPYSFKPFDCSGCLSFWLYLVLFGTWSLWTLPLACGTGLLTLIIRKQIHG